MKKRKVAFCLRDMQLGGVESVLIRTLDELSKNDNLELNVITFVDIKTPVYKKYFDEHKNIKTYSIYPCKWLGTELPHFFIFRAVIHILRDIYRGFRRMFVMRQFRDINVFIDYHDFGFYKEFRKIKNAKKIAWFHSTLRVFQNRRFINRVKHYNNLVLLTDACANDLKKLYQNISDKIVHIYNPIDIKSIQDKAKEKIDIKGKYFVSVSRLTGDKDIKTLLAGFDMFWVKNKKPKIKMLVLGDGSLAGEYKKYASSLKSANQILFLGAKQNPFPYMKGAIANILSSYGEGLPTVLIESMALGTINIASNCNYGPSEILLNGKAGLLFAPGNAQELSKCIDDVYNNRFDINQKNATNSLKRFDAKNVAKQITHLIS